MMKDVLINITGIQGIDGEKDTVEFTTEGRFGFKDGKQYLSYDEGQLIEGGNVKTKIYINSPDSVVLSRSGDINSRMEIIKNERRTCLYGTPIGNITIGIFGETVDASLDEKGGRIHLVYTIDSEMSIISRNEVKITIKEV